jgi:Protein of unknown function (DUF1013)
MVAAPLMPNATAVWLVENTALSFDQVAEFCKLHPLEVKAIADGDAAQGIKGLDPVLTGQLSREEIEKAVADPSYKLKLLDPKVRLPEAKKKKGPRYTPVSRRQDRPNAILSVLADRSRPRSAPRRQGEAGRRGGAGRHAAAGVGDHDPARARARGEEAGRRGRAQRRCGVREAQTDRRQERVML